jgi:hypothetical protein
MEKLNQDIHNAYFKSDEPNEITFFEKIAKILSETSDATKQQSPFVFGMSRDYDTMNRDNQHLFNMFIDFAYAGSFNMYDIPFQCLTRRALRNLNHFSVVDSSYRAFPFSIVLKKNVDKLPEKDFWGDFKSTSFRLHHGKRKGFNIFNGERIQQSKLNFGKSFQEKLPVLNLLEDGQFGTASRFNLLVHRFSEIIQPRLSVNSISYSKDTKLDYYYDEGKSLEDQPSLLKTKKGSLSVGLQVQGCIEGYEIWTQSGVKLSPIFSEYIPNTHGYIVDIKLPLELMENPFDPGNTYSSKSEDIMKDLKPLDKPDHMTQNQIPLTIMMDQDTQNLQSVKLNLKCVYESIKINKFHKFYPQSHLIKGIVDPGYFAVNLLSKHVEFKNANNIFQLTVQDISKLEDRQLIRQTFLSNIEIISDFDLFFQTNDPQSLKNLINFRTEDDDKMFDIGDHSIRKYSEPRGPLKILKFNENSFRIDFQHNLKLLATYWDIEFTSFADIGCCTTSTLGKTSVRISKKFRPYDSKEASGDVGMVGHHRMLYGRCVIRVNL